MGSAYRGEAIHDRQHELEVVQEATRNRVPDDEQRVVQPLLVERRHGEDRGSYTKMRRWSTCSYEEKCSEAARRVGQQRV